MKISNATTIEPKKRGRKPSEKTEEQRREDAEKRALKRLEEHRTSMKLKWGSRMDADGCRRDYTDEEYEELENFYEKQAAEFKAAATPRLEMELVEICILRLELRRCIASGDSAGAKRYSDMINSVMTRESMKAGDAKSLEATRIDSLIVNLEKKGAIKDGKIVGKKELAKILLMDHPQYHTSMDVVDAMQLGIINTMKRNNGESELDELPLSAQVEDVFGELLMEPSHEEKKAMAETGIVPPKREQKR